MVRCSGQTRRPGTILGLAFPLLLAFPGVAGADDVDDLLKRARSRLVSRLESTLDWAKPKKISGYRHEIYERILTVQPDHKRARKVLAYRRDSEDDPWVQDPTYVRPPDWNEGMRKKARKRVTEAFASYRDKVLVILSEAPEPASGPTAGRTEATLSALVDLMPQDATLRTSLGDVQHGDRWVLPETATGEDRRANLRGLAAAAASRLGLGIQPDDKARAKNWDVALRTAKRRVFGTVDEEDVYMALLNMEVGDVICPQILGPSDDVLGPTTLILLTSREEAKQIFTRMNNEKALRNLADVSAQNLGSGLYVSYRKNRLFTRVGALRQLVDSWLDQAFPGRSRGWVTEGVGQRITWYVSGQHGPHFVNLRGTERLRSNGDEPDDLPDDPAAWPAAAAAVLDRDGPLRLVGVLTRRLNAMEVGDVLVAYGLAAYLIEARPELFAPLVHASIARNDPEAYLVDTLGASAPTIMWRLRRWLLEVQVP